MWSVGCGSDFLCSNDLDCGADGQCESNRYCSFPDELCASGRRYGQLAGGGLSNTCVAPDAASGSTGEATSGQGTSTAGSVSDAAGPGTMSTDDSATGSGSSPLTNSDGPTSAGSSTDPGTDGTSTTTGGMACDVDEFDVIGAQWDVEETGGTIVASGGELVYDFGPRVSFGAVHGVSSANYNEATLFAEVTEVFDAGVFSQFEVGITTGGDEWVYAYVGSGDVGLVNHGPGFDDYLVMAPAPDFQERLHLALEITGGEMRTLYAADDDALIPLAAFPAPDWIDDAVPLLDVAVFEAGDVGQVRLDRFRECR